MKRQTLARLNQLRKLIGGSAAVFGALILTTTYLLNIFIFPLEVGGLILLVAGLALAMSHALFEFIVTMLSW